MRYTLLFLFLCLFVCTHHVYGFLPSESTFSESSTFLSKKIKRERLTIENKTSENKSEEELKKIAKQNKKEFKKAIRKAIFSKQKTKFSKQKNATKNPTDDPRKPSIISIVSLISGSGFFAIFFLLIAGVLSSVLIDALLGIAAILGIIGFLSGIIGLATNNTEKHHAKKTVIFSVVGIASGIILALTVALLILALRVAFG